MPAICLRFLSKSLQLSFVTSHYTDIAFRESGLEQRFDGGMNVFDFCHVPTASALNTFLLTICNVNKMQERLEMIRVSRRRHLKRPTQDSLKEGGGGAGQIVGPNGLAVNAIHKMVVQLIVHPVLCVEHDRRKVSFHDLRMQGKSAISHA